MAGREGESAAFGPRAPWLELKELMLQQIGKLDRMLCVLGGDKPAVGQAEATGSEATCLVGVDSPCRLEECAPDAPETRREVERTGVTLEVGRMENSANVGAQAHLRDRPGHGEEAFCVEQRRAQGATEESAAPMTGQERPPEGVGVPGPHERRAPEQAGVGGGAVRGGLGPPVRRRRCPAPVIVPARKRKVQRRGVLRGAPRTGDAAARQQRGGGRRRRPNHGGATLATRGESSWGPRCGLALRVGRRGSLAPRMAWEPRPPPWPPPASPW